MSCASVSPSATEASLATATAPLPSLPVISTNQFKNGTHIEVEGTIWRIVEFQHVKPGKGGAFVRTKLKSLGSGSVVEIGRASCRERV